VGQSTNTSSVAYWRGERPVQVRLDQIPDNGQDLDCTIEPTAFSLEGDSDQVQILETAHFVGKVARAGTDVYLTGTVTGLVELVCSRCVQEFAFPLQSQVEVHYIRRPDPLPEEVELEREELEQCTYQGEEIDIAPEIRDQLLLSIPLKPLCKEDCLGLCSRCGANLNFEQCECAVEEENHRLDVLKQWKERHEPTKEK